MDDSNTANSPLYEIETGVVKADCGQLHYGIRVRMPSDQEDHTGTRRARLRSYIKSLQEVIAPILLLREKVAHGSGGEGLDIETEAQRVRTVIDSAVTVLNRVGEWEHNNADPSAEDTTSRLRLYPLENEVSGDCVSHGPGVVMGIAHLLLGNDIGAAHTSAGSSPAARSLTIQRSEAQWAKTTEGSRMALIESKAHNGKLGWLSFEDFDQAVDSLVSDMGKTAKSSQDVVLGQSIA